MKRKTALLSVIGIVLGVFLLGGIWRMTTDWQQLRRYNQSEQFVTQGLGDLVAICDLPSGAEKILNRYKQPLKTIIQIDRTHGERLLSLVERVRDKQAQGTVMWCFFEALGSYIRDLLGLKDPPEHYCEVTATPSVAEVGEIVEFATDGDQDISQGIYNVHYQTSNQGGGGSNNFNGGYPTRERSFDQAGVRTVTVAISSYQQGVVPVSCEIEIEIEIVDLCYPPIDCAAPPVGCEYVDPEYDQEGCLISCGDLKCAECGNGILEGDEQCDKGGKNGEVCTPTPTCTYCNQDCEEVGLADPCYPHHDCAPPPAGCEYVDPEFNQQGCLISCGDLKCAECGNGILEGDEQCDKGDQNGIVCTPDPVCEYCAEDCTVIGLALPD